MDGSKQEQFLEAYDEHSDALFRYCFFKVSDREIAKDLLQETFTKTWMYITDGGSVNNMKSFLYRTLSNLIIDTYRKKKITSLDELAEEGFDYGIDEIESLHNQIDGAIAMKLLRKLPSDYRDIIFMKYVDGLNPSEISEIIGETTNTVNVRLHRGLQKTRELLKRKNGKEI